jgi:predicted lipid carrier protein YhbT
LKLGNLLDTADDDLPRQFHQQRSKLADQLTQRNRRVLQLPDESAGK